MLKAVQTNREWDLIIVGGGATGLGAAVDAASRGLKTLLLERGDFAKGTSSRSTKLIHGGLRYLKQGNLSLVIEALKERGILCRNAPHLVSPLGFLVPSYHWWEGPFYGIGLKLYDLLAGKLGLQKSHSMSLEETLQQIPTLQPEDLRGGTLYFDGQFDDARLAITLAQTAADHGATLVNYMPVLNWVKEEGLLRGVEAIDLESGEAYTLRAKVILQATGVFSDELRRLDDPKAPPLIAPSQGIHLVLDRSFWPSDFATIIPHTEDGRVVFFVPWHRHLLVGTTDTPVSTPLEEPAPQEEEIDFLLRLAGQYLNRKPKREDILSVFTGLRPLVQAGPQENTAALSRDHTIVVSPSGLITIAGGKWTTYRKMAEDAIDKVIAVGHLKEAPCQTERLPLHGYLEGTHPVEVWASYGTDAEGLQALIKQDPTLGEPLHPRLPYIRAEIAWGVRYEMGRTLEDLLARRTRALFLDVKATLEIAPAVARLMAQELNRSPTWEREQVSAFEALARSYQVSDQ